MDLRAFIRDIRDFPKEGIVFMDITPLIGDANAFKVSIDRLADRFKNCGATKIVCAEARGFIFGAPLAYAMGIGFVPVRKPGKLPYKTTSVTYDLEYGTDTLHMHEDALIRGEKILVIDDVLATGGTLKGMLDLVQCVEAEVVGIGVLLELGFLKGREKLGLDSLESLIEVV
ncbi:adenine phosphoribosyltransferase [Fundidesulfovibrio butyratiphilus]